MLVMKIVSNSDDSRLRGSKVLGMPFRMEGHKLAI